MKVPKDVAESLKRRYGSVGKGIRALLEQYRVSLGPRDERLRRAWEALLRHAAGDESEIAWRDALSVVSWELGVDEEGARKVLRDLCAEGYLATVRTGVLKVFRERQVVDLLRHVLGI